MSRKHESHDTRLTSQLAYAVLNLGPRQKEVYDEIWNNTMRGFYPTDRELARALGYGERNKVSPRRSDLMKLGLITKLEKKKKCSISGKLAKAWKINLR